MPRWNFGSNCHCSVTERLCWREKGSPRFARITHGNFTAIPRPLRFAQQHGAGDKGTHRTVENRRPQWVRWDAGYSRAAILEWNLVAQAWESQGESKTTSGPCHLAGAPCGFAQILIPFSEKNMWVLSHIPGKEEGVVISSRCPDAFGSRHCIAGSVPLCAHNLISSLCTQARPWFCGAWSWKNLRGPS